MAQNIEPRKDASSSVPETPFNTPAVQSALARAGDRESLRNPNVATIGEDEEPEEEGRNPASLLANVSPGSWLRAAPRGPSAARAGKNVGCRTDADVAHTPRRTPPCSTWSRAA